MIRTLMGIAIGLVLAAELAAGEAVLRLQSPVSVAGPVVQLSDLGEIQTADREQAQTLAATELFPAPAPGESTWLDIAILKDHLHRRKVNLAELSITGPNRIEIRRSGTAGPTDGKPQTAAGEWQAILHRMIEANVCQTSDWPAECIRVELSCQALCDFLERTQTHHWQVVVPERWRLGAQVVQVEVADQGETSQYGISVTITLATQIVVARRSVARGTKITAADVELAPTVVRFEEAEWIRDPAEVVGKEAIHTLAPNRPITRRDVKTVPLVFKNSPVTVYVRYGTAWLQFNATALEDGGPGEWIEVVNPEADRKKRREIRVRVIGFGTAEIAE